MNKEHNFLQEIVVIPRGLACVAGQILPKWFFWQWKCGHYGNDQRVIFSSGKISPTTQASACQLDI